MGDNSDKFPMNPDEWKDSDLDGIGDNSDYSRTMEKYKRRKTGELSSHSCYLCRSCLPRCTICATDKTGKNNKRRQRRRMETNYSDDYEEDYEEDYEDYHYEEE